MNQNRKSILARLLATENIQVHFGQYKTASFSPSSRELRLPIWSDSSNDLADMLVGHEVGHALYTPAEGWHNASTKAVYPRSYANIVEDIRIERMIQDTYPGLKGSFKRGYKELLDRDFFGIVGRDISKLGFMDRLNVKSKLRDLIVVPFSKEELPYVKMAAAAETFEDVDTVCLAIHAFLQKKREEKREEKQLIVEELQDDGSESEGEENSESSGDVVSEGNDEVVDEAEEESVVAVDASKPTDDAATDGTDSEDDSTTSSELDDKGSVPDENGTEVSDESDGASNGAVSEEVDPLGELDDQGVTDDAFRERESELLDASAFTAGATIIDACPESLTRRVIISYAAVKDSAGRYEPFQSQLEEYNTFLGQTNKTASLMAREFEMRKAAYQQARTKTSKTGMLDVSKLHNYKFTDDIFLRNDTIGNAKSHGMVMIVDFSVSMQKVVKNVIDQTIMLAMFCKKVSIPFEVYSFTSAYGALIETAQNGMDLSSLQLVERLNSDMSRQTFKDACEMFYMSRREGNLIANKFNRLGNTPTIEALDVTRNIIKKFQAKYKIQNTHFVMISDGEPGMPTAYKSGGDFSYGRRVCGNDIIYRTAPSKVLSFKVEGFGGPGSCQDIMIAAMKKEFKLTTHCFYIVPNMHPVNNSLRRILRTNLVASVSDALKKEVRKNKFAAIKDIRGFDNFMIMRGDVDALDDEFDVKDDASVNEVKRAFQKFVSSKKGNRAMATKFGALVAM